MSSRTPGLADAGVFGIREWWQLPDDHHADDDAVLLCQELELWSWLMEKKPELMELLASDYQRGCRESGRPTYAEHVCQAVESGRLGRGLHRIV